MRRTIRGVMTSVVVCLLGAALTLGQTRPEQKPLMAEEIFKNVRVLRGISVNQFMATMGFFSASLGENCTFCHVEESGGSWERYADDNAHKETARRMIGMMTAMNKSYFGGRRMLTCYSCHRGSERPKVTPDLAELYGPPLLGEPDEIPPAPDAPAAETILNKYIEALGGAQRLASLTSFAAKGSYQGFAETEKSPVEVWAKAPNQRVTIVHSPNGDITTIYDGRGGWTAAPKTDRPVPVLALSGAELEAARLDAEISFPARIKQALSEWRVGFPSNINDRDVQVVQGMSAGRSPVKLYFDQESGLLVRLVRYLDSPVGLNPTQIDYSDYREVAGVKMPFRWTVTWLDGRSTTELSEVQVKVPIDSGKFAQPATPTARKP
jgi:photosynthetic reaction center cytochrome c subunit